MFKTIKTGSQSYICQQAQSGCSQHSNWVSFSILKFSRV